MTNHQHYIDVIQAHMRGEKIEYQFRNGSDADWRECKMPSWDFSALEYRIAPPETKIPDSIDWSHVAPKFEFMARDENGRSYIFTDWPRKGNCGWIGPNCRPVDESFASYKRGTTEWHESLVERPASGEVSA